MLTARESDEALVNIPATCQKIVSFIQGSYEYPTEDFREYLRILELVRSRWLPSGLYHDWGPLPPTVRALWDNLHLQMLDLSIAMGRAHLRGIKRERAKPMEINGVYDDNGNLLGIFPPVITKEGE